MALLDPTIPDHKALLEGIQGNILKGHGRHHTANLFIQCNKGMQPQAKAWLTNLVNGEDAIIKSGYDQWNSSEAWKKNRTDTGLFACIHISAPGYQYLLGDDTTEAFEKTFQNGMQQAELNDPPTDEWDNGIEDCHFMLLLANTYVESLATKVVEIQNSIIAFGNIDRIERGDAIFNEHSAGIEHFGYADGISQPLFFEEEWHKYKEDNGITQDSEIKFDPRPELKTGLVLIKDPFGGDDEHSKGSYFVFRKLEQNVRGFKVAEAALARQLGLKGEDEERAGAMLVGRFEDGTPVEVSDEEGGVEKKGWEDKLEASKFNNFDYISTDASRCPFHAHARKTNPRSDLKDPMTGKIDRSHIMARRGIPYGAQGVDGQQPEGGVGLLFMSYQASIGKQFEKVQKEFANNRPVDAAGNPITPKDPKGLDLIIGQDGPKYPLKWGKTDMGVSGFGQYVHMKGGQYFFAPCMAFLRRVGQM